MPNRLQRLITLALIVIIIVTAMSVRQISQTITATETRMTELQNHAAYKSTNRSSAKSVSQQSAASKDPFRSLVASKRNKVNEVFDANAYLKHYFGWNTAYYDLSPCFFLLEKSDEELLHIAEQLAEIGKEKFNLNQGIIQSITYVNIYPFLQGKDALQTVLEKPDIVNNVTLMVFHGWLQDGSAQAIDWFEKATESGMFETRPEIFDELYGTYFSYLAESDLSEARKIFDELEPDRKKSVTNDLIRNYFDERPSELKDFFLNISDDSLLDKAIDSLTRTTLHRHSLEEAANQLKGADYLPADEVEEKLLSNWLKPHMQEAPLEQKIEQFKEFFPDVSTERLVDSAFKDYGRYYKVEYLNFVDSLDDQTIRTGAVTRVISEMNLREKDVKEVIPFILNSKENEQADFLSGIVQRAEDDADKLKMIRSVFEKHELNIEDYQKEEETP